MWRFSTVKKIRGPLAHGGNWMEAFVILPYAFAASWDGSVTDILFRAICVGDAGSAQLDWPNP